MEGDLKTVVLTDAIIKENLCTNVQRFFHAAGVKNEQVVLRGYLAILLEMVPGAYPTIQSLINAIKNS